VQDLGTTDKLSFSSTTLSFADADPDVLAQVPASGGPVTITAKARAMWFHRVSGVAATLQKRRGEKFWVINEPPTQ
jgi:hypothetical protein